MRKGILVYHSPWPIGQTVDSGSKLRPLEMRNAFERLGVDILVVDGNSHERKKKWSDVYAHLPELIGLYSELRTIPMALSDPDHFPRHPFMDLLHFNYLHKEGVPTSAFYRDIFWRFPFYSEMLPWHKRYPTKLFYLQEIFALKHSLSHIFVPSIQMAKHFPVEFNPEHISALPPGSDIREAPQKQRAAFPLQLLYVGGVLPPVYNLTPMLKAVTKLKNVNLTLCCRENEWEIARNNYPKSDNISIVHHAGDAVLDLFSKSDILTMYWEMNPYLEFAMPVKLFQSLGLGVPIITNSNSEMGDFVESQKIGWTAGNVEELSTLLSRLASNPLEIENARRHTAERRLSHNWDSRAKQVLDTLNRYLSAK